MCILHGVSQNSLGSSKILVPDVMLKSGDRFTKTLKRFDLSEIFFSEYHSIMPLHV